MKENKRGQNMKNWVIALIILILPLITYYFLDKNMTNNSASVAVAQTGKPVVIKFHSSMCLDCKKLETVTQEVMPLYESQVDYKDINVQSSNSKTKELVKQYNITLVPTMIFQNSNGETVKRTEGYLTKDQLENIIKTLLK